MSLKQRKRSDTGGKEREREGKSEGGKVRGRNKRRERERGIKLNTCTQGRVMVLIP